ncbi:MAG: hypothetical protein F6K09_02380 [Merismopedia sp. SIO2A8]|nr:hypothetical protein [Symploca sp. SIO2B6]NET47575.1 hypothetical protein [Merismopedia sp. SIO2A8]
MNDTGWDFPQDWPIDDLTLVTSEALEDEEDGKILHCIYSDRHRLWA